MLQSDVHFSVGFPVFAVKYFSKLEFCIYDCLFFGLDFLSPLLSISQNWDSAFITVFFAFIMRGNIALMCTESLACV